MQKSKTISLYNRYSKKLGILAFLLSPTMIIIYIIILIIIILAIAGFYASLIAMFPT